MSQRYRPIGRILEKGYLTDDDNALIEQSLEIVKQIESICDNIIDNNKIQEVKNDYEKYSKLFQLFINLLKLYIEIGSHTILENTKRKLMSIVLEEEAISYMNHRRRR